MKTHTARNNRTKTPYHVYIALGIHFFQKKNRSSFCGDSEFADWIKRKRSLYDQGGPKGRVSTDDAFFSKRAC